MAGSFCGRGGRGKPECPIYPLSKRVAVCFALARSHRTHARRPTGSRLCPVTIRADTDRRFRIRLVCGWEKVAGRRTHRSGVLGSAGRLPTRRGVTVLDAASAGSGPPDLQLVDQRSPYGVVAVVTDAREMRSVSLQDVLYARPSVRRRGRRSGLFACVSARGDDEPHSAKGVYGLAVDLPWRLVATVGVEGVPRIAELEHASRAYDVPDEGRADSRRELGPACKH